MFQRLFGEERTSFSCPGRLFCFVFVVIVATGLTVTIFLRMLLEKTSRKWLKVHETYENGAHECGNSQCINVTVWDKGICERTFENLALFPKFPLYPDRHYCTNNFSSVVEKKGQPSIKRIQTHLRPTQSGFYKFRVRSSVALRVFLVTHRSHDISVLIDYPRKKIGKEVFSNSCFLENRYSYYIEVVLFHPAGKNYFDVEWLVPGSVEFRHIQSAVFPLGGHVLPSQHPVYSAHKRFTTNKLTLLSFVPRSHITKIFPSCSSVNFSTSNVPQELSVYPPLSSPSAHTTEVIKYIMKALQNAVPSKYPSSKIIKVESTQNSAQADSRRLLIDLEFEMDGLDYRQRLSEYLISWYNGSNLNLCSPSQYQWNRWVTLNFVFLEDCYDNQMAWVNYFIQNMAELLETTLDLNMKVIVTTCDERQASRYNSRLRSSGFDQYVVVVLEGGYSESRAMKAALSVVEDSNSIAVLCKSRLQLPTTIIEEIRQHTFFNTMAYSPVPFQLDCGYFPGSESVKGKWCPHCRGLLALFKRDWKRLLADDSEDFLSSSDNQKLLRHVSKLGIEMIQPRLKEFYQL